MRWALLSMVLLLCVSSTQAATTTNKKIGGAGPIDRPTAHVSYWCFQEWSCGTFDTFVADGDSALVRITARNWDSLDPNKPLGIKLDNFYVVEQSSFNAEMDQVGTLANDYGCAVSSDLMLDIDNVIPAGVAYGTKFDGGIGPEWNINLFQISYSASGIYEDPFDTNAPITTGSMALGTGTGPEFVVAELQLSGLTPGWTYVISYWWQSSDDGVFPANCAAPNDDLEIEIFGEETICTPDPPLVEILDIRTLAWEEATGIWRFQLLLQNVGSGPALGMGISFEDADAGIAITESDNFYGDLPSPSGGVWTGPFEADLSGYSSPGGDMWLQFLFQFDDDCHDYGEQYHEWYAKNNPLRNLVDAPSARAVELRQNAPNPFNPRTSIGFRVERAGLVSLEIFDPRGRMVRHLLHRRLDAGEHRLDWDGRDEAGNGVAAGPYLYRLSAGGQRFVRKMMLLK